MPRGQVAEPQGPQRDLPGQERIDEVKIHGIRGHELHPHFHRCHLPAAGFELPQFPTRGDQRHPQPFELLRRPLPGNLHAGRQKMSGIRGGEAIYDFEPSRTPFALHRAQSRVVGANPGRGGRASEEQKGAPQRHIQS